MYVIELKNLFKFWQIFSGFSFKKLVQWPALGLGDYLSLLCTITLQNTAMYTERLTVFNMCRRVDLFSFILALSGVQSDMPIVFLLNTFTWICEPWLTMLILHLSLLCIAHIYALFNCPWWIYIPLCIKSQCWELCIAFYQKDKIWTDIFQFIILLFFVTAILNSGILYSCCFITIFVSNFEIPTRLRQLSHNVFISSMTCIGEGQLKVDIYFSYCSYFLAKYLSCMCVSRAGLLWYPPLEM